MSTDQNRPATPRLSAEFLAMDRDDEEAVMLAIERDTELETGAVIPLSHVDLMKRLKR